MEILTSAMLSELYQTSVEVLEMGGRIVIVGAPDSVDVDAGGPHHHSSPAKVVVR
jgi:zinc/manganese transport system ATP-binding protein